MSEILDIEPNDKTVNLTFKAGELTERFVEEKFNLPNLLDALSRGAQSVTLKLDYKSKEEAEEVANNVKNKLAEFLKRQQDRTIGTMMWDMQKDNK